MPSGKAWSREELDFLKENYMSMTNSQLANAFPSRSLIGVYKKAYKLGFRKSQDIKFANKSEAIKGKRTTLKKMTSRGYVQVYRPEHQRADKNGFVMEHIVVFEEKTGISIPKNCSVHHLNGDKTDNRIQNLCMMEHGAHTAFHNTGKKIPSAVREKISQSAKKRFSDKTNHPSYKNIDTQKMSELRDKGMTVKDICILLGISKTTFYRKLEE